MHQSSQYSTAYIYNQSVFHCKLLANTYVLGIIDGTYVGMCEDTGTI